MEYSGQLTTQENPSKKDLPPVPSQLVHFEVVMLQVTQGDWHFWQSPSTPAYPEGQVARQTPLCKYLVEVL